MSKVWLIATMAYWLISIVAVAFSRFDIASYMVGCSIFCALLSEDR